MTPEYETRGPWSEAAFRLRRHRAAQVSGLCLGLIFILIVIGPGLSPYGADEIDWDAIWTPPSLSNGHLFGTDSLGRDLLVRTLTGGQLSLAVGLIATLVSLVIGVSYGVIAGYLGGRTDAVMMRVVDILYALPFMFFVILLVVFFGRHLMLIFVAIGAINWLDMARIVRGQTLSLKQREFIEAARVSGAGPGCIIRRHLIPNLLGTVIVYATLIVPQAMLVESFLSFLGLGVQPPATSWGALVSEGAQEMERAPWLLIFPAGLLTLTLLCLNFLGDGLRDALDPKDH